MADIRAGRPAVHTPNELALFEPSPRRVRAVFNKQVVGDSKRMMLLHEPKRLPVYYFPKEGVRFDFLEPSEHTTHSEYKGEGVFWHVRVGDRVAENAACSFHGPPEGGPDLAGHVTFEWGRMDRWYEEDDEVFVHARDPYKRVDVLHSSRHIRVAVDGVTVAETRRPCLLFETGLPTRYYIPKEDVRTELLEESRHVTRCPYKGAANYYSLRIGDKLRENLVWYYTYPIPECPKIEGLLCFFNEKVDIYDDDELQPRPLTPWS
ncbi:MAG: DUF427 domain-containing protein [Alphaproteobacteria bacterium]